MYSLKTDIQTSPGLSLKKISVTTFINSFIVAYDSTAQDLAARIHQKWPLLDKKLEFYDTTLTSGTIKPWKWLALMLSYNISESRKRRYTTLKQNWRTCGESKITITYTVLRIEIVIGRLKLKWGCLMMSRSSKTDTIRRLIIRYSISLFWLRTASQKLP